MQFEVYLFWTSAGEEATVTEYDAPRVNRSLSVSVGTLEGGASLAQLIASTRMFPAVTCELYASAQFCALQFET